MSVKSLVNTNYFDLNSSKLHLNSSEDSTSSSTGSFITVGGIYVEKNINNHGNIISSGTISGGTITGGSITVGTDDSTSISTGSLIVPGGAGIEKNVYIGKHLHVLATDNSTSSSTGAVQVSGGIYINKDVFCDGTIYGTYIGSPAYGTNDSTSSSSGALIVPGGAGIGKSVFIGEKLNILSSADSTSSSTGALLVSGGIGVGSSVSLGDILLGSQTTITPYDYTIDRYTTGASILNASSLRLFTNDWRSTNPSTVIQNAGIILGGDSPYLSMTDTEYRLCELSTTHLYIGNSEMSTSSQTGSLVVDGGCDLYSVKIWSTEQSTSSSNGSLIVQGGTGIMGDLNIGGDVFCDNIISASNFSSSNISNAVSGNFTSGTFTATVSKCGNTCTLQYATLSGAGASVAGILAVNAISTSYRPASNISMPVLVSSNSVYQFGLCTIDTAGTVAFYMDAESTGFPITVTNSIVSGSVSYII